MEVRGEGGEEGMADGALVVGGCGGGAEAVAGDLGEGWVRRGMEWVAAVIVLTSGMKRGMLAGSERTTWDD